MPTTWRGVDSDEKVTIAWAVKKAVAEFRGLGAGARESCEERRTWLLGVVQERVRWLEPCRAQMNVTWDQPTSSAFRSLHSICR